MKDDMLHAAKLSLLVEGALILAIFAMAAAYLQWGGVQ
jgi:hypothetical protein